MEEKKPDALVVCSTLNQITNYLVIKEYMPEKVYNITFDEKARKKMNENIKIDDWDKQLKNLCKEKLKIDDSNIKDICLGESDFYNIEDIVDKIDGEIDENDKKTIYWHITGGQRLVAMAVAEFIKDRSQDKWVYMEGNIEKLLEYDNELKSKNVINYSNRDLDFKQAFDLTGFKYNDKLSSTNVLDINNKEINENLGKEQEFYNILYGIFCTDASFREQLLESNSEKTENERKEYITKAFKDLKEYNKKDSERLKNCKYDIYKSDEMKKSCPAGYIFEKIAGYKIYKALRNAKFKHNINQIAFSIKTQFDDRDDKVKKDDKDNKNKGYSIIDELDIALLSSTGKLINFECKTGGMEGDNAKSHNYTTYRLSGVFGMPILISPLLENERKHKEKIEKFGKQCGAIRSAERAELYVWTIDKIEENLKDLLRIRE
ncbi:hypothetical protein [Clostridium luticellarii]|uniref:Uncharacterized protein n=1 Tax=Clostridium luticellarii TaxID=1691940 RepID=A0A2T0B615_9CLOT|nr:hypothetical protein [Clostridium luticellarii]PRR79329.1 hypothetical protein CLLU_35280 [Clostridium luticellarii]